MRPHWTYVVWCFVGMAAAHPTTALSQIARCDLPLDKRPVRDIPDCAVDGLKRVAADPGAASITDLLGAGLWLLVAGVLGIVAIGVVLGVFGGLVSAGERAALAREVERQQRRAEKQKRVAEVPTDGRAYRLGRALRRWTRVSH